MSNRPPYDYEKLLQMKFNVTYIDIKERPDEVWVSLNEGTELDDYVWRVVGAHINDQQLLEFGIECINTTNKIPDELYEYGAAMIIQSLADMIDE